jgi:hypothetical protein
MVMWLMRLSRSDDESELKTKSRFEGDEKIIA